MMDDLTTRRQLAVARTALRTTQDDHDRIKAVTEHAVITQVGGSKQLGVNAEDRDRALRLALEADPALWGHPAHVTPVAGRSRALASPR